MEGYISYADLKNGTLTLYDVYLLNKLIERKVAEAKRVTRETMMKKAIKG